MCAGCSICSHSRRCGRTKASEFGITCAAGQSPQAVYAAGLIEAANFSENQLKFHFQPMRARIRPSGYRPRRARSERHANPAPPITASTALGFSGVGAECTEHARVKAGAASISRATIEMRFTSFLLESRAFVDCVITLRGRG